MTNWYYLALAAAVIVWVTGLVVFLNHRWQERRRNERLAYRAKFGHPYIGLTAVDDPHARAMVAGMDATEKAVR